MWPLAVLTVDRIGEGFYRKKYGCFAGPKKVAVLMR